MKILRWCDYNRLAVLACTTAIMSFGGSLRGAPPVITVLPDIVIGDKEAIDAGTSGSSQFVFPNAFRFADYVTDVDTQISDLVWTFIEGDDAATLDTATQYFRINGKDPLAVGTAAEASLSGVEFHNPSSDIATVPFASFENIVLSSYSGAFVTEQHAAGKIVKFVVSDGENLTSASILVRTIHNAYDTTELVTLGFGPMVDDQFTTSSTGWGPTGYSNQYVSTNYNAENTALYVTVQKSRNTIRIIGWLEAQAKYDTSGASHLRFSDVGPGKIIRGKFHMFATGQEQAGNRHQIPGARFRLSSRFAFASVLEVLHSDTYDPEGTLTALDLAPSTDPTSPTVYRVDLVRPDLPYYASEAGQQDGVQRMFETIATPTNPEQNGTLALTESSLGVYEAPEPSTDPTVLKKVYMADDLNSTASRYFTAMQLRRGDLFPLAVNRNGNNSGGSFGSITWTGVPPDEISVTGTQSGITLSTAGTSDTKIAVLTVDYLTGTQADTDHRLRVRTGRDKTYVIRFVATATGASSDNAMIRFRSRTAKFSYNSRLEIGNPWNLGNHRDETRDSNIIAIQALPGTGGYAGPFDLIVNSPLTSERSIPSLEAEDGPGEGPETRTTPSRRDIYPGMDIIDSLGNSYFMSGTSDAGEKGNVSISRIEIREYDRVPD